MKKLVAGLLASLPIVGGYVPVAITFGLIARSADLSTFDSVAASLIVFAGAAQFLAVGMYEAGLPAVQIVFAGFLLNLRHLLMSSVIARNCSDMRRIVRSILAFGVTDEVFGVASWRSAEGGEIRPGFLAGLELGAYLAWTLGTLAGAILGDIIPSGLRTAMGMALYALFASLLAGQVRAAHRKGRRRLVRTISAAAAAIAINVILREIPGFGAGTAFPVAMVGGAIVGMAVPAGGAVGTEGTEG